MHTPPDLLPPDLSPHAAGNTGTPYVHLLDSGRPGPTVMLQALMHGNELCGAIALDRLLREQVGAQLRRGRLILAFANIEAFLRFDAAHPFDSRCVDEDMNRVWADAVLQGPRDSLELRRARALLPFVEQADVLLDLHSMQEDGAPALAICGTQDKSAALARALGQPATLMVDTGHAAGLRLIDRPGFADPASPRQALLVECGAHWARESAEMAFDVCLRLLVQQGLVDAAWAQARLPLAAATQQRLLRVTSAWTAQSEDFRFLRDVHHLDCIPRAGTPLAEDGGRLRATPFDDCVLVMPTQRPLKAGQTAVRLGRFDP